MLAGSGKKKMEPIKVNYHIFKGSREAEYMLKNFSKEKPILVYFDPDIDGLISGLFVCRYLLEKGYPYTWYINKNREHGFKLPISQLKGFNIIAVDFLITRREVKELLENGNNIISIDHHVNEEKFICLKKNGCFGVVINNQYPFELEDGRYLSGAGVVFEFLRSIYNDFDTKENRALVGLTLLSDVRNIENRNARGYLTDLYMHPYKGYIGYLLENSIGSVDYGFGVPRLDRNYVDFTFSPLINSCLRFGKEDMVVSFILGSGFIDRNYRDKQKELTQKLIDLAVVDEYDGLYAVKIRKEDVSDDVKPVVSSFIGLVASRFLDSSHSCISYLEEEDGSIGRASFRGRVNGLNYLKAVTKDGLIDGVGHEPAFGIIRINTTEEVFREVGRRCIEVESGNENKRKIIYVNNMSMFVGEKGYNVAMENCFCLSQNRTYLKFTGDKEDIVKKRSGARYTEYSINGVSVMCFDDNLKPDKDLILPMLERNVLCLYLNSENPEDFTFDD